MAEYVSGHVKHDPATGSVAIRSIFPDDPVIANRAWLIASSSNGPRYAATSEVAEWVDLYVAAAE